MRNKIKELQNSLKDYDGSASFQVIDTKDIMLATDILDQFLKEQAAENANSLIILGNGTPWNGARVYDTGYKYIFENLFVATKYKDAHIITLTMPKGE